MKSNKQVWDWRGYILKYAPDNPTYKHVLLTLSCYMNSSGDSCFPSIKTLTEASSLSKPTVVKYLEQAHKDGWIIKGVHGYSGQGWKRNEYTASIPDNVVKQVNHEGGKGGKADKERRLTSQEDAVKEVNSISPYNSPSNSPSSGTPKEYEIPSLEQVEEYFLDSDILDEDATLEAQKFINHYEDMDWRKNRGSGKRIDNWHRQAGTWIANYKQYNKNRLNGNTNKTMENYNEIRNSLFEG